MQWAPHAREASEVDQPSERVSPSALAVERSKALVCRRLFQESSALLRIGRFELVRTLGRGGCGVVYEAIDGPTGERVALKVLHGATPWHLYRLKQELRSLAEVNHPNLVMLHELVVEGGDAYFTMDLVEGVDCIEYTRRCAASGEPAVQRVFGQLAEGIRALHSAGRLHRDLKPSNVLVTSEGRAVVLDFGLVLDAARGAGSIEGTAAYMAPEQQSGAACEASDWYAFGLMLDEALAGDPREPRASSPTPRGELLSSRSASDSALAVLVERLTDPDPKKRPDFTEIRRVFGGDPPSPRNALGSHPCFVARTAELQALVGALERSRSAACFALVRGESGIGKSALLREFWRSTLAPAGAVVLVGRCYERESVAFKGLDGVVDELSRHLATLSGVDVPSLREAQIAALLRLFPVLGRVPWLRLQKPVSLPPHELRTRGAEGLRHLFASLARSRPLVLYIEKLQWSDVDTGWLLGALSCGEDAPAFLIVASERVDAGNDSAAVAEFRTIAALSSDAPHFQEIRLGPLDSKAMSELARSMLPDGMDSTRLERLISESRGNPLLMRELSGRMSRREPAVVEDAEPSLDALFDERFERLSPSGRRTLSLIAAAGRPVSAAVLAVAASRPGGLRAELKELRAAQLIRMIRSNTKELCELEHDRIGESILRPLPHAARVELHRALAHAFDAKDGPHSEALVEQYAAAEMPLEAARCARRAGGAAFAGLAFGRAAWMYERAVRFGAWTDDDLRALHQEHAVALGYSGRRSEAAAAYARAAALTADLLARVRLEQLAAEQLMHDGRYSEGELLLERVYAGLGLPWPKHRATLLLSTVRYCIPRRVRPLGRRIRGATLAMRRARVECLSNAGRGIQQHDPLRAIHNALICFDESERLPDPIWHARARGARGMMRCFGMLPGDAARGLSEVEQACRVADDAGDVSAQVDLYRQLAAARYLCGKPRAALRAADSSERYARQLNPPTLDVYYLMGIVGSALVDLGELKEAYRRWNAFSHEARLHKDLTTTLWLHGHPAQYAALFAMEKRDLVQAALDEQARLREQHPSYGSLAWTHALSNLEYHLYFGAVSEAERAARRDAGALFESGYSILSETSRLARARARLALAAELPVGPRRARLLRGASRDANVRWRRHNVVRNGAAGLVEAGVALLQDRPNTALAKLDDALRDFESGEAKLMIASVDYCKGTLVGGDMGRALRQHAAKALGEEGIRNPVRWVAWTACGFRPILSDLK